MRTGEREGRGRVKVNRRDWAELRVGSLEEGEGE